jgi:hypothetical protein
MNRATQLLSRRARAVLLLAGGVLFTLALSQCRMVEDRVMAPAVELSASNNSRAGACVTTCARTHADAMQAEADLHTAAVQACAGNPDCLLNESNRHTAAVARIIESRRQCMEACHHQGGGSGGR